jgi:hypothetical protein
MKLATAITAAIIATTTQLAAAENFQSQYEVNQAGYAVEAYDWIEEQIQKECGSERLCIIRQLEEVVSGGSDYLEQIDLRNYAFLHIRAEADMVIGLVQDGDYYLGR